MSSDDLADQLDRHLVRIVNVLRESDYDRRVDVTAAYCGVSPLLVLRIGHDAQLLTQDEESRYTTLLAERST